MGLIELTPMEAARFWSKVRWGTAAECWIWEASTMGGTHPYGQVLFRGKHWRAHRLSYAVLVGDLIPDMEIDHLCRNPMCINPAHLEQVPHQVNVDRGSVWQREKTHCLRGHPFGGNNLKITKGGHRLCRECEKIRGAAKRARARARLSATRSSS